MPGTMTADRDDWIRGLSCGRVRPAAAARAYVRLFGYPLPAVEVGPPRSSRRWRD
jgi:hypothetical protein